MKLELIASLLFLAAALVAVSGIAYYVMLKISEAREARIAQSPAREQLEIAQTLRAYETELRQLEIKARTGTYTDNDSERYARLIYRRKRLQERTQGQASLA